MFTSFEASFARLGLLHPLNWLLKQFGALLVGRLSGAKGVLAKSALSNMSIVADANELQVRTSVAQAEIGPLFGY